MSSVSVASPSFGRFASLAVALGALGGATLVLFAVFFSAGKLLLLPYGLFVVATAVVLKSCRVPTYPARFMVGLASFLLATAALYVFIAANTGTSISFGGHLWRILLMVGIGAAINAAVARVSESIHG